MVWAVQEVTRLQSEDPGWFLAWAFPFKSRATNGFIRALAEDFDVNICALADMVRGKKTGYGGIQFPGQQDEVETRLEIRMKALCNLLNVSLSFNPTQTDFERAKSFLLSAGAFALNANTRSELMTAMSQKSTTTFCNRRLLPICILMLHTILSGRPSQALYLGMERFRQRK